MNTCLVCGAECDHEHDEAYCPLCDELHGVIDRADSIQERGARNEREEEYVAMGIAAYEQLEERRGAYMATDLGDGNTWMRMREAA